MNFKTIEWKNNQVVLIDQRKLPTEETYVAYSDYKTLIQAIQEMVVRGAPAIGVAGAMGVALASLQIEAKDRKEFVQKMDPICDEIANARPTAVNLSWGVRRIQKIYQHAGDVSLDQFRNLLIQEALAIFEEDVQMCEQMGKHGAELIQDGDLILTHCNAGALATAGQGTALSPIYEAIKQSKNVKVFADETRPFLQGARLTAWELMKNGVDVTVIPDVAAASLLREGKIKKVIVGSDRIAANGDVANKIGTYSVALAAKAHHVPFYVVAPFSTIDWNCSDGSKIPIEERTPDEVTSLGGRRITPAGVKVRNPAFDVTPNELITGIITERGIATQPLQKNLKTLYGK